ICDDVQDMELTEALASLMALFMEIINEWGVENTKAIKSKVIYWIAGQSACIKALLADFCWES
ncbi:MAG: hypothetical protein IKN43_12110, partial [Selenomonadaceae bacterium]|nr:hypothetical protein [Selenomonadaceae bacterium]